LFILTSEKNSAQNDVSQLNQKSDRKIEPIIIDANEFVKLKRDDKALYENIERGITLWQAE